MNTPSASPAESRTTVLVWDAPVRIFHWLLVLSFAGAYLTAESERWRLVHVTLGYTMAGLVAFRIVWGLVGTYYARFVNFVRGPRAVTRYLQSLLRGQPEHHTGHNPAGALAIVGLLGLACMVAVSGWATYNDLLGGWLEEVHEGAANTMLFIVVVHIVGVIVSGWMHRENLVRAMVTGRKPGQSGHSLRSAWWPLGIVLLATVLGFWYLQWKDAPTTGTGAGSTITQAFERSHARDDD